ncbi:hypothetical protein [Haloflavibacter putidus]|uniref:Right handed beta helix region n=1 Tax=Haloflavibacter putidus TaxID=2576776 RepID=A0A507ZS25_9FLAO|nr:hypothetical protein [Haloflavibacter putidus]TQD39313.1 hypothetical protein FKR84_05310 [Haloflavibacter putidus]
MKYLYSLLLLCSIVFWSSCRNDFETDRSSGKLVFSKDTVYLDTVFSGIGSSTYNLTVHNKSKNDIHIPSIRLGEGENSYYRLNVDGLPGKTFENIEILAEDSIFVFVETTANIDDFATTQTQFLYTDAIEFDTGANQQNVELVTLIQDAHFLYPEKFADGSTEELIFENGETQDTLSGFYLDDSELNFTNQKPYVIYGLAAVPSNKTLQIDAGARIHFHNESGIIVANNGSLQVNGLPSNDPETLENEVIFEGNRLEPSFSERPGQWFGLWLTQGSTNNSFNHTTIKNAQVGILMESNDGTNNPTLTLKNTQIYNSANFGLLARTGHIVGENLVINNAGQAALNLSLGGKYSFNNSTFVNYWNNSYRNFPAVLVENRLETAEIEFVSDLIQADFKNCIIYGNENLELGLNPTAEEGIAFNYKFENCLIKYKTYTNDFTENDPPFSNETFFENVLLNEAPFFLDPNQNLLQISNESAANGLANPATATQKDILGNLRSSNPDAGAYESTNFTE